MKAKTYLTLLSIILFLITCKKEVENLQIEDVKNSIELRYLDPNSALIEIISNTTITSKDKWGICFSNITNEPTVNDSIKFATTDSLNKFKFYLYPLESAKNYSIRIFIDRDNQIEYFKVFNFTTPEKVGASPEIIHRPINGIFLDSAVLSLEVRNTGMSQVLEQGFCVSNSIYPTIFDRKVLVSNFEGVHTVELTRIKPATFYYVRPYVISEAGTFYGSQRSFVTDTVIMGSLIKGGRLFYVFKKGESNYVEGEFHGLIYYNYLISGTIPWSPINENLNLKDSTFGAGEQNTNTLINSYGEAEYSAWKAKSLKLNGYNDWYMPNISEARILSKNYGTPFSSWLSNEYNSDSAYAVDTRKVIIKSKNSLNRLILIRRF